MATEIVYKEESYAIIGACFEVYNEQGSGFLEAVYQESLEIEFNVRGIPFVSQPKLNLRYKETALSEKTPKLPIVSITYMQPCGCCNVFRRRRLNGNTTHNSFLILMPCNELRFVFSKAHQLQTH